MRTRRCRDGTILTMVMICLAGAPRASAERVLDAGGRCVDRWTPRSLLRGPVVLLDAPLVPLRFAHGAVLEAAGCGDCRPGQKWALGISGLALGLLFGSLTGFVDAITGLADIVCLGTTGWLMHDPTRWSLRPIRFVPVGDVCCFFGRPRDLVTDPCGRDVSPHLRAEPKPWFGRGEAPGPSPAAPGDR